MTATPDKPSPASDEAATTQPLVLELRIHGVNNTPPHQLLDLPMADVVHVGGDELGSFWRQRPGAAAPGAAERGHVPEGVVREAYSWGSLARLSFGVGSGVVAAVIGALTRLMWTLLLPFALTNVAYWSRRLHHGPPGRVPPAAAGPGDSDPNGAGPAKFRPLTPGHAGGAWIFRLGGMALTLITTVTAVVLSVDLVGVQCMPLDGGRTRCTAIPDAAGFLDGWSMGQRMALLSLVPVGLVVGLFVLSSRTRARFELATRNQHPGAAAGAFKPRTPDSAAPGVTPRWPLLSTPGFWDHSPVSGPAAKTHLAAAVVTVVGLCSQQLWEHGSGSLLVDTAQAWWLWAILTLVSAVLLVWILEVQARLDPLAADVDGSAGQRRGRGAMSGERRGGRADRAIVVAGLTYVVFLVGASVAGTPDRASIGDPMSGVQVALPVLVGFTVLLAVIGLGVRGDAAAGGKGVRGSVVMGVLGLPPALVVAFLPSWPASSWRWDWAREHPALTAWAVLAIAVAAGWSAVRRSGRQHDAGDVDGHGLDGRGEHGDVTSTAGEARGNPGLTEQRSTGWGGRAPGVFLGLGLFLGLVVVSALTLTVGDRLNGDHSAGSLLGLGAARSRTGPSVDLVVPGLYGWFALAGAVGIALLGLVIVTLALTSWRRGVEEPWPAGRGPAAVSFAGDPAGSPARVLPGGPCDAFDEDGAMSRRVFAVRRTARIAHRAEPLLALLLALVTGIWLLLAFLRQFRWAAEWVYWPNLATAAGMVLSFIALGVFLGGGTTASDRAIRPLGVLWDLACAVPRAAHPLGPPCYGERVVPEVLARVRWWLSKEGTMDDLSRSPRGVILSAHSLGGVISVAAVLGAPWDGRLMPDGCPWDRETPPDQLGRDQQGDWMVPRLALITYGTQLRAYFSRFFPELFGPAVLGVAPAPRSRLRTPDPWDDDWPPEDPPFSVPHPLPGSVRHLLGQPPPSDGSPPRPRWYSLWHLTDYLGFPLVGRPPRATVGKAISPADSLQDWYAQEIDFTAYLLSVLSHSDYPRTEEYAAALSSAMADLTPRGGPPTEPVAPGGAR